MELKPCPFCGGEAGYVNDVGPNDEGFWEWYECATCGAKTDSAAAWNRRADLASPLGAVAMREAAVAHVKECAKIMQSFGDMNSYRSLESAASSIAIIPAPDDAAQLAAALALPEVADLQARLDAAEARERQAVDENELLHVQHAECCEEMARLRVILDAAQTRERQAVEAERETGDAYFRLREIIGREAFRQGPGTHFEVTERVLHDAIPSRIVNVTITIDSKAACEMVAAAIRKWAKPACTVHKAGCPGTGAHCETGAKP